MNYKLQLLLHIYCHHTHQTRHIYGCGTQHLLQLTFEIRRMTSSPLHKACNYWWIPSTVLHKWPLASGAHGVLRLANFIYIVKVIQLWFSCNEAVNICPILCPLHSAYGIGWIPRISGTKVYVKVILFHPGVIIKMLTYITFVSKCLRNGKYRSVCIRTWSLITTMTLISYFQSQI